MKLLLLKIQRFFLKPLRKWQGKKYVDPITGIVHFNLHYQKDYYF